MIIKTIKNARTEKGLTQLQCATYAGISEGGYNLLEHGKRRPRDIRTAKKLAELLGIPWTIFYEGEPEDEDVEPDTGSRNTGNKREDSKTDNVA